MNLIKMLDHEHNNLAIEVEATIPELVYSYSGTLYCKSSETIILFNSAQTFDFLYKYTAFYFY